MTPPAAPSVTTCSAGTVHWERCDIAAITIPTASSIPSPSGAPINKVASTSCPHRSARLDVRRMHVTVQDRHTDMLSSHMEDECCIPDTNLSMNVGRSRTVSHLALIGLPPPDGSLHQYGISPQRSGSSVTSPVL